MQNNKNFYIRGFPIALPIGNIHFIKMYEYEEIYKYQKLLFFSREDLYDSIKEILDINKEDILKFINPQYIDELRNYQLIDLIKGMKDLGYYDIFKSIYNYFCEKNVFDSLIQTDEDLLIYKIQIMGKLKPLLNEEEIIKNVDENLNNGIDNSLFINIVKNIKELGLYKAYSELFDFCFKEEKETFDKIKTDKELNQYLKLIIDMNYISEYEEENEDIDPEIKKFNMYEKMIKKKNQGNITFKSMYASLWLYLKKQPEYLTIYQFNALFGQLGNFKAFDATTNMYSNNITMWCADSELVENEKEDRKDEVEEELINQSLESMQKISGDIR